MVALFRIKKNKFISYDDYIACALFCRIIPNRHLITAGTFHENWHNIQLQNRFAILEKTNMSQADTSSVLCQTSQHGKQRMCLTYWEIHLDLFNPYFKFVHLTVLSSSHIYIYIYIYIHIYIGIYIFFIFLFLCVSSPLCV